MKTKEKELRLYLIVEYKSKDGIQREMFCLLKSTELSYNELEILNEFAYMFGKNRTVRYEDGIDLFDVFNITEQINTITWYMGKITAKYFMLYDDDINSPDFYLDIPKCN